MERDGLQTPYDNAVAPTPGGGASGSGGTRGGVDLGEGSAKETANMSSLPPLETTVGLGEGDPGASGQVPMPPVASPGTIKG